MRSTPLFATALVLTLSARDARAADINDTVMHYYLTSGYNVLLDIQRSEQQARLYRPLFDLSAMNRPVTNFFIAGHYDVLFAGEDVGQTLFYNAIGKLERLDPRSVSFVGYAGGTWLVFQDTPQHDRFLNLALGAEVGVANYFTLAADVSVNFSVVGSDQDSSDPLEPFDLDQLSVHATVPIIDLFTNLRYDLGSKAARDLEVGWGLSLGDGLGAISVAYSHRFEYVATGLQRTGDFAARGLPPVVIEDDQTGMLKWSGLRLTGDDDSQLLGSAGLAAGNISGVLRFAFAELAYKHDIFSVFANFGRAYERIEEQSVFGGAGGVELGLFDGMIVARAQVGVRDWDFVDRVGGPAKPTFRFMVSGGMFDTAKEQPASDERDRDER